MKRNLLIITSAFPNNLNSYEGIFVREQLLFLKEYFDNVYVIRPQYYINSYIDFLNIFPQNWKEKPTRKNYSIDNIKVFFPKVSIFQPFKNWEIKQFIHKNNIKFDIIHSHFIYPSGEIGNYLKTAFQVKHISTGHGFDVYDLPFRNMFWNYKIKKILKNIDRIITVSKKNIKSLEKLEVPKTKLSLINNGYNAKKFFVLNKDKDLMRKELSLPLKTKVLITVGNLISIKNQSFILKAMYGLKRKGKNYFCIIIGEGYLRKKLQKEIDFLGLGSSVKMIGKVENTNLINYYNAADLFILPSIAEGNPGVMYESLGSGLPFLGTNIASIKQRIKNGENGYTFLHTNIEDFIKKIEMCVCHKWNKQNILESVKKFSWEKLSKQIIKEYE